MGNLPSLEEMEQETNRRNEAQKKRLQAEKRLKDEREREANRHKEELERIRREAESRLKENLEKNRLEAAIRNNQQLQEQQVEREKLKYQHDEKMRALEIENKHDSEKYAILLKKIGVDEKKVGIMEKLVTDKTTAADFNKMLDKNPNIFKEIGMGDDAATGAMKRMVETLQLEAGPESLESPDFPPQSRVDEGAAIHEQEISERDAQAGEHQSQIMEEEEQRWRELNHKKKQVDKLRSDVTDAMRSKANPKLGSLLVQHSGAFVDMGLAKRAPTAEQLSTWSTAHSSSSEPRIQELD